MDPRLLELTCAPLLLLQGRHVRRVTPVLPEAGGDREGIEGPGRPVEKALRLLILGDSSAAGVGVHDLGDAMAGHLVRGLAGQVGRAVRWRLVARSGLTAAQLHDVLGADPQALDLRGGHPALVPVDDDRTREPFDVAVVVVGVNDVTTRCSPRAWIRHVEALSASLRQVAPSAWQLWSGLPPMHRFPALPQPLRAYLGERARRLDRVLIDWVARDPRRLHLAIPALEGEGMMASDGFHPGPMGHRAWGELLSARLARALSTGAGPA